MANALECRRIIRFDEPGFGRTKDCPNCGGTVSAETYYQKTALCHATVCEKCRKSLYPSHSCTCTNYTAKYS